MPGDPYHPPLARKLLSLAAPVPGETVLDVACGTGLVALMAAQAVGPGGRVVGVDLSQGMLQQVRGGLCNLLHHYSLAHAVILKGLVGSTCMLSCVIVLVQH